MGKVQDALKDRNSVFRRAMSNLSSQLGGIIACDIFCFSLAGFLNNTVGRVVLLVFCSIVYYMAIFATMWSQGNKDSNRVKFGHMEKDWSLGFRIGAIANIPVWIMCLMLILGKLQWFPNIIIIFKILNPQTWPLVNMISDSMFLSNFSWLAIAVITLFSSLNFALSGVFYILGYKDVAPMQKLMYENKKKKQEKKTPSNHR